MSSVVLVGDADPDPTPPPVIIKNSQDKTKKAKVSLLGKGKINKIKVKSSTFYSVLSINCAFKMHNILNFCANLSFRNDLFEEFLATETVLICTFCQFQRVPICIFDKFWVVKILTLLKIDVLQLSNVEFSDKEMFRFEPLYIFQLY